MTRFDHVLRILGGKVHRRGETIVSTFVEGGVGVSGKSSPRDKLPANTTGVSRNLPSGVATASRISLPGLTSILFCANKLKYIVDRSPSSSESPDSSTCRNTTCAFWVDP